jgi:hypothetical protein
MRGAHFNTSEDFCFNGPESDLSDHNLLFDTIIELPALILCTAPFTMSSTMAFADLRSLTTAETLPIKKGCASSNKSSGFCAVSRSFDTGRIPLLVSSLISSWPIQLSAYVFD